METFFMKLLSFEYAQEQNYVLQVVPVPYRVLFCGAHYVLHSKPSYRDQTLEILSDRLGDNIHML
jgi:hypothetical protein